MSTSRRRAAKVILEGKNLGALIGRQGETLDAIQQLTSYAVNRSGSGRVRSAGRRGLPGEAGAEPPAPGPEGGCQGGPVPPELPLEPMNAYERHVIHTALQDVPGVTTYSTGTEPGRRVVVAYDRDKK